MTARVISAGLTLAVFTGIMFASTARSDASQTPATWIGSLGAGSLGAWNYLGVRREVIRSEHVSLYVAGGLGTILIGGGAAYYSARNASGAVVSISAGVVGANASLAYQFRLNETDYIVAGASYGHFFMQYEGWAPILAIERRF